ncbi:hypothetical protein [Bradyrhizobium sp. URHD0069]|uniref:hypothetical protein n=1 Tax=Bradyrhizobium sp. URHD0069 TaxID=1380355 RepID=UPI000690591C
MLADDKGAAQALALVEDARGSITISFDPNCGPNLVKHKAHYGDLMDAFAATADIVRMSGADFEFLYGGSDYAGALIRSVGRVERCSNFSQGSQSE